MGVLFDVAPLETQSASSDGRHRITGLSLVNPTGAAGRPVVNVWAEDGSHEEQHTIGTLSPEVPIMAVRPKVVVGDELVLRHDPVVSTLRFYGRVLYPRRKWPILIDIDAVLDERKEEEEAILDDGEEEEAGEASRAEFPLTDDEDEEEARPAKRRMFADEE